MQQQLLKAKIHNAFVTGSNINSADNIVVDENLMNAVNIIEGEQVHVINHRNGERLITYILKGKQGSGEIHINGPAALKITKGDKIIVIAYCAINNKEAKEFKPKIIFPQPGNII